MTTLNLLATAASAWIVLTYTLFVFGQCKLRAFHWANALGGPPIVALEVATGAYGVLPVTTLFCIVGFVGLARD